MRTFLISAAAAVTALAVAAPAAAQWQQPYGNAYGYNNYGHVRSLQALRRSSTTVVVVGDGIMDCTKAQLRGPTHIHTSTTYMES